VLHDPTSAMRHSQVMDQAIEGARTSRAMGRRASSGPANRRTRTRELQLNIPTRELATTTIAATLMAMTRFGVTQQMRTPDGTIVITPTSGAKLRIAATTVPLMTKTKAMVVCASARMVTVVLIVQFRHPVDLSIVLGMDQQMISMQPMVATAPAQTISEDKIVPFHQLAAASTIAMGMPLSTRTAQMVVNAIVLMAGLEPVATCRRRAKLPLTAAVMAKPRIWMPGMAASAVVKLVSLVKIARYQQGFAAGQ